MADPARLTHGAMLIHAARGLGKIDVHGRRGATLVSVEEIEAMACCLVAFGLIAIPPGGETPERLIIQPTEEASDAV